MRALPCFHNRATGLSTGRIPARLNSLPAVHFVSVKPAFERGSFSGSISCIPTKPSIARVCPRSTFCSAAKRPVASGGNSGGIRSFGPDWKDRAIAALPYLLPFISAYSYGKFLFYQVPALQLMVSPFLPLIGLYHSIPFASLICFLGLYAGVATNDSFSKFVRFNTMQAVLLDICLIIPRLIEQVVGHPQGGSMLELYILFQNSVWIAIAAATVYGVYNSIIGQIGRIPFVADAVDQQLQ